MSSERYNEALKCWALKYSFDFFDSVFDGKTKQEVFENHDVTPSSYEVIKSRCCRRGNTFGSTTDKPPKLLSRGLNSLRVVEGGDRLFTT